MNGGRRSEKYLRGYGLSPKRPLAAVNLEGVEQVVVIPALAERVHLFGTLASLARNPSRDLDKTLVICVVNNHKAPLTTEEDIRDNQETLLLLNALLSAEQCFPGQAQGKDLFGTLARSDLRLGVIDASSPGWEIPEWEGGVGTARKIGMDAALEVLDGNGCADSGAILCLDADTLVEENYLSALAKHFSATDDSAAVVAYAHQIPTEPAHRMAICAYEIFLRAYVLGLSVAGSPYAFHAIGSAMACTAHGYTSVRGMNRRGAAEDFHFLNKLAKVGKVGTVTETTVYPSGRVSHRVPFGTGRQMQRSATETARDDRIHHPEIFSVIGRWLGAVMADPDRDAGAICGTAGQIHPLLADFLDQNRFMKSWERIRQNARNEEQLQRQFHVWFDGLRTLRLIHLLARRDYPPVGMVEGIKGLLAQLPLADPDWIAFLPDAGSPDGVLSLLSHLRIRFPRT